MTGERALQAVVFDLDGVVTDTAGVHFAAWKKLFDGFLEEREGRKGEELRPFSEEDYQKYVDGRPRYEGVRKFLESRGIELPCGDPSNEPGEGTICALGNRKNEYFQGCLEEMGAEVFDTTVDLIRELRERGIATAVASSSRNCKRILEQTGLGDLFDARVDGIVSAELGLKGKPEPDIFTKALELLDGIPSAHAAIVEDAVSGVEAGRNGRFGLVLGVDRGGNRERLYAGGADLVVDDLGEISVGWMEVFLERRDHARPNALAKWEELKERFEGKKLALFLDYDGTLSEIAPRPELATLGEKMREALKRVAEVWPTHIVSGRGRTDVEDLVGLKNLYYAGSHGFDIKGPAGSGVDFEKDPEPAGMIDALHEELTEKTAHIEGALVENKRFSCAVHYRQVADKDVPELEKIVDETLKKGNRVTKLKKAGGKKVFEIRPNIDWDKGKALAWLRSELGLDGEEVVPLYIGDDVTDEDAFRELKGQGIGILVTDVPRDTAAEYALQNVDEVRLFLNKLAEYGRKR